MILIEIHIICTQAHLIASQIMIVYISRQEDLYSPIDFFTFQIYIQ